MLLSYLFTCSISIFSILVLLSVCSCSTGNYCVVVFISVDIIELTDETFDNEILLSGKGNKWFIQFSAPVLFQYELSIF